jgi:hypothetical protein
MPQSTNSRRVLFRLVLFTLAGWVLWALGKGDAKPEAAGAETAAEVTPKTRARNGFSKRRLATSLAFATLFFAGAAFSAGAGDLVVNAVETTTESATAETTTEATETEAADDTAPADPAPADAAPTDETPADPAPDDAVPADDGSGDSASVGDSTGVGDSADQPADESDPADSAGQPSDDDAAPASGGEDEPAAGSDGSDSSSSSGGSSGGSDGGTSQPAYDPPAAGPDSPSHTGDKNPPTVTQSPEVQEIAAHDADVAAETIGAFATVWLHRTVPDPTPRAKRLDPRFARTLREVAEKHNVGWPLLLGVVRARGHYSRFPATRPELARTASTLARLHRSQDAWHTVLALSGRTAFADRAIALTRYDRAVGMRALVRGLVAAKKSLQTRVLKDDRIDIYAGGRSDIAAGKVDVRILALMRYLAEAHGQVTVSCLISGHRLYARPGVVSAHIYGEAVDIAALGGRSIYGNQQPGGLTEQAVRNILLLPVELRPKQVISLLGLGGPSFALADHYDHIHVGY